MLLNWLYLQWLFNSLTNQLKSLADYFIIAIKEQ